MSKGSRVRLPFSAYHFCLSFSVSCYVNPGCSKRNMLHSKTITICTSLIFCEFNNWAVTSKYATRDTSWSFVIHPNMCGKLVWLDGSIIYCIASVRGCKLSKIMHAVVQGRAPRGVNRFQTHWVRSKTAWCGKVRSQSSPARRESCDKQKRFAYD